MTRSTHTNLDVMEEKRIDDDWDADEYRNLSDSWTGFMNFYSIEIEASTRIYVVGRETDKNTGDFQTRSRVSRSVDQIGKSAQNVKKKNGRKSGQN